MRACQSAFTSTAASASACMAVLQHALKQSLNSLTESS
eukprot:CAMPEP_0173364076 /NCGR_PEP_ID=MMETSP1144-20121109/22763_1 /TAXON_ID=483371 /ORGANISM="non described non described, Strain CCMP2298" /LENGTH=37 /DNA_ID= /DNA_START= /DNA_END= /DNA_ORIENTATION=